jgi:ABC exporter DevB family membrane fusion protein
MRRIASGLSLPVLLLASLLTFSTRDRHAPTLPPKRDTSRGRTVAAEGRIVTLPGAQVEVASEITGRIQKFLVQEGDWVRKGQTIAIIDQGEMLAKLDEARAELAIAKAQLAEVATGSRREEIQEAKAAVAAALAEKTLAQRDLERYQLLYSKAEVSRASLEQQERAFEVALNGFKAAEERERLLEAGPRPETLQLHERMVERSRAGVEYLKSLLEKSFIRAPISGKLIRKNVEAGEVVYAEHPVAIATLTDIKRIEINAEVDETDIAKVAVGDPVEVASDAYPGRCFSGKVREIADYVGQRATTPNDAAKNIDMKIVQVKISVPPGAPFRLGMTVNIRIEPKDRKTTTDFLPWHGRELAR